jgi:RpiB/LacA/LacB family sugar-phosphate isomerase
VNKKKYNLLLPVAGKAQRFLDEGYTVPKPLIMAGKKNVIDLALESISFEDCNLIFVCRKEHVMEYGIDQIFRNKFGDDAQIITVDYDTSGAVSTCLLAKEYIDNENPLLIYTPDVCFQSKLNPDTIDSKLDGFLLTFKANNPSHSYVQIDEQGFVTRTAEKKVISSDAAVGVYYFKSGKIFVKYAEQLINQKIKTNDEFYICPVYNLLVKDGLKVSIKQVEKMHVLGTPKELEFYINNSSLKFGSKPIGLCSDHSGYTTKLLIKKILNKYNIEYIDFGCYVNKDSDYNSYVIQATEHIQSKIIDFCFGVCRTGQGVNILANKENNIRAALIFDSYTAEMSIRHNCANFFSIPEKYVDEKKVEEIIQALIKSTFDGGRHVNRLSFNR